MEYKYQVFLSWTVADRALKDDLNDYLRKHDITEIYDSDEGCLSGEFRIDYIEALETSQVYLMILTDSVLNNPTTSGMGFYSEVRKEGNYAMELESRGVLNILILNLSSQLRNGKRSTDFAANNGLAKHFFAMTKGFTQQLVDYTDGMLDDVTKSYVAETTKHFVDMRQAGTPVLSDSSLIKIARDAAIAAERKDDLSAIYLFLYLTPFDYKMACAMIRPYLARRKREAGNTGTLLFGELELRSIQMTKGLSDMRIIEALGVYMQTGALKSIWTIMMRHPLSFWSTYKLEKRFEQVPAEDRLHFINVAISAILQSVLDDFQFDLSAMVEMVIELYRVRREDGITLSRLSDELKGLFSIMGQLPQSTVKNFTNLVDSRVNIAELSFETMNNLHLAVLVDSQFNNPRAIENYRRLLHCVEELHSQNHPDFIHLLITYAQTCLTFGQKELAAQNLQKAFFLLKQSAPISKEMADVCALLLVAMPDLHQDKQEHMHLLFWDIAKSGLSAVQPDTKEFYNMFVSYTNSLLKGSVYTNEIQLAYDTVDRVLPLLRKISVVSKNQFADILFNIISIQLKHNDSAENINRMMAALRLLEKASKNDQYNGKATILRLYFEGQIANRNKQNDLAHKKCKQALRVCIRYHSQVELFQALMIAMINTLNHQTMTVESVFDMYFTSAKMRDEMVLLYKERFGFTSTSEQSDNSKTSIGVYVVMSMIVKGNIEKTLPKPFRRYKSLNALMKDFFVAALTEKQQLSNK